MMRDLAPAKVNLALHVLGRRADGYHDLDSLVVFADVGDDLAFTPGGAGHTLSIEGPTAASAGPDADNLVLRAARALADRVSGLTGGGSIWKSACRSRPASAAAPRMPRRRSGCSPAPRG